MDDITSKSNHYQPATDSLMVAKRSQARSRNVLPSLISLGAIVIAIVFAWIAFQGKESETAAADWRPPQHLQPKRALATIEKLCSFGPRVTGTETMLAQIDWLKQQFAGLADRIDVQEFSIRHPLDGSTVQVRNLIVRFNPQAKSRLLVCAHYDTRPFPDQDLRNQRGKFLGANDGASGPAFMIEMAHALKAQPPTIGVDLVLFDAEEFVYRQEDTYFLGSSYFARDYRSRTDTSVSYKAGVLVDMIADKNLELYYEVNSFRMARDVTTALWKHADDLKIDAFVPQLGHEVRDDHLPLNDIGGIPTCDIIDFDYPTRGRRGTNYWHTMQDLPDKCSGESVCKVAAVVLAWIAAGGQ